MQKLHEGRLGVCTKGLLTVVRQMLLGAFQIRLTLSILYPIPFSIFLSLIRFLSLLFYMGSFEEIYWTIFRFCVAPTGVYVVKSRVREGVSTVLWRLLFRCLWNNRCKCRLLSARKLRTTRFWGWVLIRMTVGYGRIRVGNVEIKT